MTVKTRLFDRNYGDFGEFDPRSLTGCRYDTQRWATGMVADTLRFDPAKGKKIPRRGPVDLCSANLEKWFDPAEARVSACGELPLRESAPGVFAFDSETFFPMDALGLEPAWNRDGTSLAHDYAFCMEINAGFTQRGGEVLRFRGDDDLWVYLDGELVIDLGGIHYALDGAAVRLDTLPGYAGKQGRYRDLDVYFCSRIPSTSVFGMQAPLDPRPLPLAALRIADTAGRPLVSRDVVTGRTRVCAAAQWETPDPAACGNHAAPTRFAPAAWDLNGAILGDPAGSECVEIDPAGFPHGTRVQLTARSAEKTARISLVLARAARPKAGVLRGNGRAERVEVAVDSGFGDLPDGLEVEVVLGGQVRYGRAFPSGSAASFTGTLGPDGGGPPGLTGFAPLPARTRQTHFGKLVEQDILLSDGVGPALTGARVRWAGDSGKVPGALGPAAWLEWETSERMAPRGLRLADLVGKRGTGDGKGRPQPGLAAFGLLMGFQGDPPLSDETALQPDPGNPSAFRLPLGEAEARAFRPGDSLSLAGTAQDALGNPAGTGFVAILPPGRSDGLVGSLRIPSNPARGQAFLPDPSLPALVLAGRDGRPLRTLDADLRVSQAGGPLFLLPTRVPLARIDLRFHDHLGAAVRRVRIDISDADWEAVRQASPGDTAWLGLRWYPVSASGAKLGTGAYIVEGRAWTRNGALLRDRDGSWIKVTESVETFGPTLFGWVRE